VVQQSIDELQRRKAQTTIIIAHRLSTVRNADRICYIQQGQIMEIGTHEELIRKPNGMYADLVSISIGLIALGYLHTNIYKYTFPSSTRFLNLSSVFIYVFNPELQ